MNNNNLKGVSFTAGFFILIGLSLLGFVLSGIIGLAILSSTTGGSVSAIKDALNDPANANSLRIIQTISVFISMFLPAFIVASILYRKPFEILGFKKKIYLKQAGLVFIIVFASLFFAGALAYLNKVIPIPADWKQWFDNLEKSYADQVEVMVNLKSFGGYIMSIILMAFLPALCEETLFRGGLQNFLTRATKNPWLAIIIVSILFSLVHFSFYGFLVRMFLGIMLGLIFYLTGNLWLSILAHFINNALVITQAYVLTQQGKGIKEVMNEDMPTFYWGFIALPFLYYLFRTLKNTSIKKDLHISAQN